MAKKRVVEKRRIGRPKKSETSKRDVARTRRVVRPRGAAKLTKIMTPREVITGNPPKVPKSNNIVKQRKAGKTRKIATPRNVTRPRIVLNPHMPSKRSAPLKVSVFTDSDNGFIRSPNLSPIEARIMDFDGKLK